MADDSVEFDLKKVTGFFKKKEKEKGKEPKPESHPSTHASTVEHKSSPAKGTDSEVQFDLAAILGFFKKYGIVFLILIPLFTSFYMRTISMDLPITSEWAKNSVDNYYKNQISAQIEQQYPNLPSAMRSNQVDKEFQKHITENQDQYNKQIQQTADQFKQQFKDDTGETYLGDIDTYYYFKRSEWFIKNGYVGDTRVNNTPYDTYTLAPIGEFTDTNLLYYLVDMTYKTMKVFNPNVTIRRAFSYVPVFMSMLGVIPIFFIGKRSGGKLAGFFAAMLFAVHGNVLSRTIGGASDTDSYTVTLPLIALWLFIEALETSDRKKAVFYACLSSVFIGLFAFAWVAWWYIFDFIIISVIGYILYMLIYKKIHKESIKTYVSSKPFLDFCLVIVVFVVVSCIMVSSFIAFTTFLDIFKGPSQIFTLKESTKATLWPNVYTTVAELNEASVEQAIDSIGKLPFILSVLGIVLTLARKDSKNIILISGTLLWGFLMAYQFIHINALLFALLLAVPAVFGVVLSLIRRYEVDIKLTFILIIWYLGMIFASTKGVRFTMLFIPPFVIGYGITMGRIYQAVTGYLTEELRVPENLGKIIIAASVLFFLITPIKGGYQVAYHSVPLINDAWWNALTKVKEQTPKDAIITSWWDYGHWFKSVADRRVTFDGGNQNVPQAHWVGKILLDDNEKEALGILRMLDCGATRATETIDPHYQDTTKTVALTYKLINTNKAGAKDILTQEGFDEKTTNEILEYTHCTPPPAIFITSEDMVGKAGVWAHFGSWNFSKAKVWFDVKNMNKQQALQHLVKEFNMTQSQAESIYTEIEPLNDDNEANRWIAPWPSYSSGFETCEKQDNTTIGCPITAKGGTITLTVDLATKDAWVPTKDGKKVHPNSLVYASNDSFEVRTYAQDTFGNSVGLLYDTEKDTYYSIILTDELSKSMFTRLFYFNSAGTKYFKFFDRERDITGLDILVWQVDWDRYLKDIGDAQQVQATPHVQIAANKTAE